MTREKMQIVADGMHRLVDKAGDAICFHGPIETDLFRVVGLDVVNTMLVIGHAVLAPKGARAEGNTEEVIVHSAFGPYQYTLKEIRHVLKLALDDVEAAIANGQTVMEGGDKPTMTYGADNRPN